MTDTDRLAALLATIDRALPESRDPANDEEVCISGYDFWAIRLIAAGVTLAPRPAPDTLLDVERVRRALHMAHSNYGPGACGLSADDFISDYEAER